MTAPAGGAGNSEPDVPPPHEPPKPGVVPTPIIPEPEIAPAIPEPEIAPAIPEPEIAPAIPEPDPEQS
jgi:hypothetical protein